MSTESDHLLLDMLEKVTGASLDVPKLIQETQQEWAKEVIQKKLRSVALKNEGEVLYALGLYVESFGACRCDIFAPRGQLLSSLTAYCYRHIIYSGQRYALRWALCRIVLGLDYQWWWLHSEITMAQRESITRDIQQVYHTCWSPMLTLHGEEAYYHSHLLIQRHVKRLWVVASSPGAVQSSCMEMFLSMAAIHSLRS